MLAFAKEEISRGIDCLFRATIPPKEKLKAFSVGGTKDTDIENLAKHRLSILKTKVLGQLKQIIKSISRTGEIKKNAKTLAAITGNWFISLHNHASHKRNTTATNVIQKPQV